MDDKKKKLIFLVGSLFVAVVFVTSYAAFASNQTGNSTTTTVLEANVLPGIFSGNVNGIVVNYSYIANITFSNRSEAAKLNLTLNNMVANGILYNYAPAGSTGYVVELSEGNPYLLYLNLSKALNYSDLTVGGIADVKLPGNVTVTVGSQKVPVALPSRNYTIPVAKALPIGSNIPIIVQLQITSSGQLANEQGNPRLIPG